MNVMIIQSAGNHKQNKEFRECLCMTRAINRIPGNEAVSCGRGFMNYPAFKQITEWADILLILENYHDQWIPDLSKINKPKIFWSIDAHLAFKRHVAFCKKHRIQTILSSADSYVSKFKKAGFKSKWFPNCYPDDLIKPLNIPKVYDVGFCGSILKDRKKWLDGIGKRFKLKRDIFVLGNGMVKAINSYRIHWNKNYSNDINYRTFETMGCGTLLLTNKTDKLLNLFKLGQEVVVYSSFADCLDKIRYYLKHPPEALRTSYNGLKCVQTHHTYNIRSKQLLSIGGL